MADVQPIRTRPAPHCLLCGAHGELLYQGMTDRSYAAPGVWHIRKCATADCGLAWLDPVPIEEDIGKAYQGYYTHSQPEPGPSLVRDLVWGIWHAYLGKRFGYTQGVGSPWRRVAAPLALLHPGGRDELDSAAMYLPAPGKPARVLDVGCGSGVLLARMKALGWEVEGVEIDPDAVEAGRRRGVPVRLGSLQAQKYPDDSFDAVHSAHVIEHVHDPAALLKECHRVLKPGGTLVILTPNMASWGHRKFGQAWLNLDPPRHLVLFSTAPLRRLAEKAGFEVLKLDSTVRSAWVYGALSDCIRRSGRAEMSELGKPANLARGMLFQLAERRRATHDPRAGDELRLVATKRLPPGRSAAP